MHTIYTYIPGQAIMMDNAHGYYIYVELLTDLTLKHHAQNVNIECQHEF